MMKLLLLNLALLTYFVNSNPKPELFQKFLDFITNNRQLQKQAENSCEWKYTLVKVQCNRNNKIVSHTILNEVSDTIKQRIRFIDGYQFDRKIAINQHAIIFCITFENHTTDCILKSVTLPTEVLKVVLGELGKQKAIDPETIILYNTVSLAYIKGTIE